MLLTAESKPLLVNGLSTTGAVNTNESVLRFHVSPKLLATYGLREAVKNSEEDIREFVNKHFYVDDALTSLPTADMAVSLLKREGRKKANGVEYAADSREQTSSCEWVIHNWCSEYE
jgi:hypothetical protein